MTTPLICLLSDTGPETEPGPLVYAQLCTLTLRLPPTVSTTVSFKLLNPHTQVKSIFIYRAQPHRSQICLKGLYDVYSIRLSLRDACTLRLASEVKQCDANLTLQIIESPFTSVTQAN